MGINYLKVIIPGFIGESQKKLDTPIIRLTFGIYLYIEEVSLKNVTNL